MGKFKATSPFLIYLYLKRDYVKSNNKKSVNDGYGINY